MTQKSCLSIPVGEGCVVALEDVQEPRRTPSGKGFAWESESVPRGATTCYPSNTSDYVVVDPRDGATSPKTLPEVSSEAHVAESSHGGPKLASNIDDGNTAEFGLEQCVKDSSKPIDVKEKIEATREQRLAYVDEQPPRPEAGCPDVTRGHTLTLQPQILPEERMKGLGALCRLEAGARSYAFALRMTAGGYLQRLWSLLCFSATMSTTVELDTVQY
jgi:hypothetical protein